MAESGFNILLMTIEGAVSFPLNSISVSHETIKNQEEKRMNTKLNQWIILATIALFGANYGMAATITWDGGPSPYTGTNWNDDVNWVGNVKPSTRGTKTPAMRSASC